MAQLPEQVWLRRLQREAELMRESGFNFTLAEDLATYCVKLNAPGLALSHGSIVPQNSHEVEIILGREYPYPGGLKVIWLTPIFHPNIREEDGKVCLQLLNAWSADVTVANLVQGIVHLLSNPNPSDPLNKPAADYYLAHPDAFKGSNVPQESLPRRPRVLQES